MQPLVNYGHTTCPACQATISSGGKTCSACGATCPN
jgi:predicted amidophosphoribosyltransferase